MEKGSNCSFGGVSISYPSAHFSFLIAFDKNTLKDKEFDFKENNLTSFLLCLVQSYEIACALLASLESFR